MRWAWTVLLLSDFLEHEMVSKQRPNFRKHTEWTRWKSNEIQMIMNDSIQCYKFKIKNKVIFDGVVVWMFCVNDECCVCMSVTTWNKWKEKICNWAASNECAYFSHEYLSNGWWKTIQGRKINGKIKNTNNISY